MQSRNKYTGANLLARLPLMIFAALAIVCDALAESKFRMDDFTIKPGEEKVVALYFDNTDNISSLQVDFTLPEGLTYVGFKANEERIERGVHLVDVTKQEYATNKYRLTLFAPESDPIPGEGLFANITFKAEENFTKPGKIKVDNAQLSDPNGVGISPAAFNVAVSPEIGTVEVSEPAFYIKPGGKHSVELVMNNTIDIYGVEGRITLPEGLTYERNNRGKPAITYGDRLPQDAIVQINEETGKFTITSMSQEPFGTEGPLFSVNVIASEDLAETVEIVINEVKATNEGGAGVFGFDEVMNVKVTNLYLVEYLPAKEIADGLQTKLDEAINTIAEVAPDVKDSEDITSAEADIQKQIDDLKKAIDDAYENETIVTDKETILAVVPEIEAAIEKLIEDAKKAQEASGITNVEVDGKEVKGIYTISGSKTDAAVKGTVNIVKYSDGSVKKLFVK